MTKLQETLIDRLTDKMKLDMSPKIVKVTLESYSRPLQCYSNVAEKVLRNGGKIHYGWSVHFSENLCEAERHSVWENDNDELLCVTQNPNNKNEIIFLSDNRPVNSSEQIDNIRTNITNNILVNDFIFMCDNIGDLWNRFTIRMNNDAVNAPQPVMLLIEKFEEYKGLIYGLIKTGRKERSECFCGSNKKFIHCHSKIIKKTIPAAIFELEKIIKSNSKA
jgi:hypothetical protein